ASAASAAPSAWGYKVVSGRLRKMNHSCSPMRLDSLDDRVRLPGVGTLEVAVLDEGDPSIGRASDMIAVLRSRQDQVGLPPRGAHNVTPFLARYPGAGRTPGPRVHLAPCDT